MNSKIDNMHTTLPTVGTSLPTVENGKLLGEKAQALPARGLTITNVPISREALDVANIPEGALRRDDALGNLVLSAFNLPPPPMPSFSD